MAHVNMVGGPRDGRSYDYPIPLPDMLSFQIFGTIEDYRRRPYTSQYIYVEKPDAVQK